MQWSDIVGHQDNITKLKSMIKGRCMPHALLFIGPEGIGKSLVAETLAQTLLCERQEVSPCCACRSCQLWMQQAHPDYLVVKPDGSSLKIHQMRSLHSSAALAPYMSSHKIIIIEDAGLMTGEAANSFLKLLEEPPGPLVFILLASGRQQLLDTIISRCSIFNFHPLPTSLLVEVLTRQGIEIKQAQAAARLSGGRMGGALNLLKPDGMHERNRGLSIIEQIGNSNMHFVWDTASELENLERKELQSLLRYLSIILRDLLLLSMNQNEKLLYNSDLVENLGQHAAGWPKGSLMAAIAEVETARRRLAANAAVRITCEALLIKLRKLAGEDFSVCLQ